MSAVIAGGGEAVWPDPVAGELTLGQLGERAAEAVRALNHLTRPGVGALSGPGEVCEIIAALACTARRLPQLLGQASSWLLGEQQAGRLRVDAWSPTSDPAAALAAVTEHLSQAASCAQRARHALDAAQQHLAHLATSSAYGRRDERRRP